VSWRLFVSERKTEGDGFNKIRHAKTVVADGMFNLLNRGAVDWQNLSPYSIPKNPSDRIIDYLVTVVGGAFREYVILCEC